MKPLRMPTKDKVYQHRRFDMIPNLSVRLLSQTG